MNTYSTWNIKQIIRNSDLPIHAHIPMCKRYRTESLSNIENPPVAYVNQMDAKRVCDAFRKRARRRGIRIYTSVQGITLK